MSSTLTVLASTLSCSIFTILFSSSVGLDNAELELNHLQYSGYYSVKYNNNNVNYIHCTSVHYKLFDITSVVLA